MGICIDTDIVLPNILGKSILDIAIENGIHITHQEQKNKNFSPKNWVFQIMFVCLVNSKRVNTLVFDV